MAELRPFRALRPSPDKAQAVAAPPYDVVDVEEARALADGNPDSFLHVSRPEIDLPDGAEPAAAHAQGHRALADFERRGLMARDPVPTLTVYRQRLGVAEQTGVVGAVSVADYRSGAIAVHEHTRPDKEDDRVAHVDALDAHDEPVFLMYPNDAAIDALVKTASARPPDVRLTDRDGVEHTLWVVANPATIDGLTAAFDAIPRLYVADGHHRSAAAARLHELRVARTAGHNDSHGETDVFTAVAFPAEQLTVLPYQRVVTDCAGYDPQALLAALAERFDVQPLDVPALRGPGGDNRGPRPERHEAGMYLAGSWYLLTARPGEVDENDPIARLDVSLLQDGVLCPLLGIADPRTDPRIGFVGGSRGTDELERLVDSGRYAVAFALHPTSPDEVMAVADLGLVMPPKSTWFSPKLASGLFVHPLH
ncbi:MAG TPA: DUF1015 family protein [Kineosporiaceae bacterium]|nr:DUF1015 family protein [Kineosporiaceae bacterium]